MFRNTLFRALIIGALLSATVSAGTRRCAHDWSGVLAYPSAAEPVGEAMLDGYLCHDGELGPVMEVRNAHGAVITICLAGEDGYQWGAETLLGMSQTSLRATVRGLWRENNGFPPNFVPLEVRVGGKPVPCRVREFTAMKNAARVAVRQHYAVFPDVRGLDGMEGFILPGFKVLVRGNLRRGLLGKRHWVEAEFDPDTGDVKVTTGGALTALR